MNSMREALSCRLRSRYPSLYTRRADMKSWSFHQWGGFDHDDGWFGLIDALSAVLTSRAASQGLDIAIRQVKEKLGTLRYYTEGMDEFCLGAKSFIVAMSGRVSECSGRPG